MKSWLSSDTYLLVTTIRKEKMKYNEMDQSTEMDSSIDEIVDSPDVFSRLSRSIAPEIFGQEDVKKALLLQLVGGVGRTLNDGTAIRGDIHVCLMGDPGLAKSQFLKFIASASPRGVYTTGKGSSGVGLTASVMRDPVSSETVVATGALVLADGGVCSIDEFDKMEDYDRTAVHEVMEQQTVSIAKAGLSTTLNARCSILAAANPVTSRYNTSLPVAKNINLPSSLISRFDLMFLLLDQPKMEADIALARHVTYVHKYLKTPEVNEQPSTIRFLHYYISQARHFEPHVPPVLADAIVGDFVEQRQQSSEDSQTGTGATARQLFSVLRLAQALARLRFDDTVSQSDFDEATRLCHASKVRNLHKKPHWKNCGSPGISNRNCS